MLPPLREGEQVIYGQIGRMPTKKSVDWGKRLYTPVHAFIVEGSKAVSICGKVRAGCSYSTWKVGYGAYMRPVSPLDFSGRPCYYCLKRHKEALVAETMMTKGDGA